MLVGCTSTKVFRQSESPPFERYQGGIIRGPNTIKKIAFVFTAHSYDEGAQTILDELKRHGGKASFFVTGDYLDSTNHSPALERILREDHYLGAHSDKHLLYCPWEGPKKTLVPKQVFIADLMANLKKIESFKKSISIGHKLSAQTRRNPLPSTTYWLPAYEWYNQEIADWSREMGLTLVNFTPGTRANADYMPDNDPNYISSPRILESILKQEKSGQNHLNGFILLMHLGVGPARTDKMSSHFGSLLDQLKLQNYRFVRIDDLLSSEH
jgi:peptidoglycan/xylan/chitin deacetylase (PgdA/CDA1 family)